MLWLLAAILAVLMVVEPFATPLYATTSAEVGNFKITAGRYVENYIQIPWPLAMGGAVALTVVSIYIELVLKIKRRLLVIFIAFVAVMYAMPLPYVFISGNDVVVVVSNYAKYLSLPLFSMAILIAMLEEIMSPPRLTKILAELSTTMEKTERRD